MIHIHKSFPRQMHRSSAVTRLVFTFWVQLTSFHSMTNHRILNTKTNPKQWFLAALHTWPASMCSFNFRGSKCSILHTMETCFLTAASASPAPMLGINFCWCRQFQLCLIIAYSMTALSTRTSYRWSFMKTTQPRICCMGTLHESHTCRTRFPKTHGIRNVQTELNLTAYMINGETSGCL